jgi:hypothetical protein
MGRRWSPDRQVVAGQAQQGRAADAAGADVLTSWRAAGLAGTVGRGRVRTARGARSAAAWRFLMNRCGPLPAFGELLPFGALG